MTQITTDDGLRLDVHEQGPATGRPVVLLAGFRAPATSWRYQVPALVAAGLRVIAVDLRGHGGVPITPGTTMARRAEDLHAVLDGLDLEDASLVGGSMGGNTLWAYLTAHGSDRVRDVVVIDQTPRMLADDDWPHGYYGYDESVRDTFFAAGIPPTGQGTPLWRRGMRLVRILRTLPTDRRGALSSAELAVLHDHAVADWRPVISETGVPALFVAGAESELWPATHAAAAAAIAPQGRAAVIDRAGHATNIEQPRAVNRRVLEFLAR